MKDLGNKPVMAANIKCKMKEKDINAKELSQAIEVPYTTVLSWLKGEYYPRIDKIERMSEYFGCLKSDLIEEKQEKPATNEGSELSPAKREFIERLKSMSEADLKRLDMLLQIFEKENS